MARSLATAVVTVHAVILRMLSAGPRTGSLLVRWVKQTKTFESAAHFTTHNALTKLQVAGLVKSSPSKQSGTIKVFSLTPAGEKVAKEHGRNLDELATLFGSRFGAKPPADKTVKASRASRVEVSRDDKGNLLVSKKVSRDQADRPRVLMSPKIKQSAGRSRRPLTKAQREAKNARDRARRAEISKRTAKAVQHATESRT